MVVCFRYPSKHHHAAGIADILVFVTCGHRTASMTTLGFAERLGIDNVAALLL